MKKIYLLLVTMVVLYSCKKEQFSSPNSGSIKQQNRLAGTFFVAGNFTTPDSVTALSLMAANNLSTNGFVFYAFQSYNALDQANQMGFYQLATAVQVRNGLPVFFYDITFPFENGSFNEPYPAPQFIVGDIALHNKPSLSLESLRGAFINTDNALEANNISIGDSVLVAQLGYYNLNSNEIATGGTPNFIKAWYVHPQHSSRPVGYFRDDTGTDLSFIPATHTGAVFP